jgi:hypothetical protein
MLATPGRANLVKPAQALTHWCKRRGRKVLHRLKPSLNEFRATPKFWP